MAGMIGEDINKYAGVPRDKCPTEPHPVNECAQAQTVNSEYRPTMAEEAEKRVFYHERELSRARMAASFLRAHPAFGEFINLIRSGVIQI